MSMTALVRRPSPRIDEGLVTHLERRPVDAALAGVQWEAYVAAMQAADWDTVEVAPAPNCPDSHFVEDTMVVYGSTAVISRPGAASRLPEVGDAEKAVAALGYRVLRIEPPGTLDGGDVLKIGDLVYVGRGGRTNAEGLRQLRAALAPLGARTVAVPLTKALHLKTAVTALPDGTVIGWPGALDNPGFFPHFVAMPEEPGAHVVVLDSERLLMSADAPRSADLLSDLGYTPVPVDISEFEKVEGCVTCLSVRLRDLP